MATRQLSVVITGDSTDARKSMQDLERSSNTLSDKLRDVGAKIRDVGKSLTLGVTLPIAAAGVVVGKWASDAAENVNKVNVVFGKNAATILAWSKDAERAFGLSEGQAAGFFGSVGTMLQGFGIDMEVVPEMSKSVIQLAADLGSFHNLNTAEVLDMISGAFRGEYDSLQRVIPTISDATVKTRALAMTGKENADELTAQEKALAVYQLTLEGAGPAVGDFANTSDGAANSMRIATAQIRTAGEQIGAVFLPIVADLAGKVSEWASSFAELDPNTQRIIVVVAAAAAAIGPLVWVVGSLVTAVGLLNAGLWAIVGNPIVLAIAAVIAVLVVLGILLWKAYNEMGFFRDTVDNTWQAIQRVISTNWAIIEPVFQAIGWYITTILIPGYTALWQAIQAAWNVSSAVTLWAWENNIRPTFQAIGWIIQNVVVPAFSMMASHTQAVWSSLASGASFAWGVASPILGALGGAAREIGSAFLGMASAIASAFSGMANGVRAALQGVRDAWNSTVGGRGISIPSVFGFGGADFMIPRLHSGGVFQSGSPRGEGLALLRDNEVVLTPEQARSSYSSSATFNVTIVQQPGESTDALVDRLDRWARQNGRRPGLA